ncbi:MAG: hypothetical protein J7K62_01955 [Thermoplasmata archaeon]|nr:hypothetical protein [Thermoplasmata archaeon]
MTRIIYKKIYDEKKEKEMIEIEAVIGVCKKDELPDSYFAKMPYYYQDDFDNIQVCYRMAMYSAPIKIYLEKDIYDKGNFEMIIAAMKEAGKRLAEIRKRIREEKYKWEDKQIEEIVI